MPNLKVSIFKNVKEVREPEYMDLQLYLEKTRDGGKDSWEDIVTKCRTLSGEEQKEYKKTMPTTCLSGIFNYRNDEGLQKHNGVLAMDLDHVENINVVRSQLSNDKYVYSCFMSTSGTGLRVLFFVEPKKHREAFLGIAQYLWDAYGLTSDPNGINISKPYIVSFDPELWLNYLDTIVFKNYIKETPIKRIENFVHTTNDFDSVLKQIIGRNINLCEDYNDYLKIGFSLVSQFGENGRGFFHDLSRISQKYNQKEVDKQYTYCLKANGSKTATISTFYYFAKLHGVKISSEQTKKIVRATRNGKKAGLKKEQILVNLLKNEGISGADDIVTQLFETDDEYNEEDSVLHQLELYIQNNYTLKMNEVTGYLEQNDKPLSPADLNTIFISAKKIMPKLDYNLMIRLLKSDFIESYNPFYKFWGSDGIPVILPPNPSEDKKYESPLIDLLATTLKTEDPAYTAFFLRKWIVGTVSAAHKIHCPLQFVLIGPQHSGKTEWFRRLPPPALLGYYAESKLDREKDDELLMTECLWVIDDEYGGKTRSDTLKLKNLTSKQYFSLRRPYGDHNEKILRLAILGGSSNLFDVLTDPTGNRRVIPIHITDVDKELYNSIDKNELWKEAFRLYKEGFDWRVTHKDIGYLNRNKVKFEQIVKERELIESYFEQGTERLSTTEICVEIEIMSKQKVSPNVIGREMLNLGYEKKSTRLEDGTTPKKWCVSRINRTSKVHTNTETSQSGFEQIDGVGF